MNKTLLIDLVFDKEKPKWLQIWQGEDGSIMMKTEMEQRLGFMSTSYESMILIKGPDEKLHMKLNEPSDFYPYSADNSEMDVKVVWQGELEKK